MVTCRDIILYGWLHPRKSHFRPNGLKLRRSCTFKLPWLGPTKLTPRSLIHSTQRYIAQLSSIPSNLPSHIASHPRPRPYPHSIRAFLVHRDNNFIFKAQITFKARPRRRRISHSNYDPSMPQRSTSRSTLSSYRTSVTILPSDLVVVGLSEQFDSHSDRWRMDWSSCCLRNMLGESSMPEEVMDGAERGRERCRRRASESMTSNLWRKSL